MKRLVLLVVLVIIFVGLPLLGLSDAVISSDDTATANSEAIGSISKANNSSAGAPITITMYAVADE